MDKKIINAIKESLKELNKASIKNHKEKNHKSNKDKVWYGRSKSLSSVFERSLANKLSGAYYKKNYYFLVDYPITLYSNERKRSIIYPDILILKDFKPNDKDSAGEIVALIDLKIDLGYVDLKYLRRKKKEEKMKLARATLCKFNEFVGARL